MASFTPEPPESDALRWARLLANAIAKGSFKQPRKNTVKNWSKFLTTLSRRVEPAVVDRVLAWYIQHRGEEFCPVADSGMQFRFKFDQIRKAMETSDDPTEEISQRDRDLAEYLANNYVFPVEIAVRLPVIVQKTRKDWDAFCDRINNRVEKDSRKARFLIRVLEQHAPLFPQNWVFHLHKKYGHLQSYTASPHHLVWRPESQTFRDSFWRAWSAEWCSDPGAFDGLLKDLVKQEK
jgi:hypothetical protein